MRTFFHAAPLPACFFYLLYKMALRRETALCYEVALKAAWVRAHKSDLRALLTVHADLILQRCHILQMIVTHELHRNVSYKALACSYLDHRYGVCTK